MAQAPNEVWELRLPDGAEAPVAVWVNGSELAEGEDFSLDGGTVRFARPLRGQPAMGFRRKLMLAAGIGVYGDLKGDSLDVHFTVAGRPRALTDLRLTMPEAAPPR